MIKLTDLLEAEKAFTATSKETGNVAVFKTKAARDAAVKAGSHEKRKTDKDDAVDVPTGEKKPNMFSKDTGYDAGGEEPKSEPKSSSYSGNTEDMKMDMQNAFETGYTGKGLKGVKKTKDGFQVNMASYMNDNSFKDVLDAFNKTNGTNFVADKVEKTAGGTRVSISEPKEEPKQDGPVKDSSGGRAGNPQVNKATKKKAEELGITPSELGREEYEKTMVQAAVAALTDSNYHSEARELIAMIEDKPEWKEDPRKSAPKIDSPEYDEWRKNSVYSSEYYDADSATEELGQTASQEAGWNGVDALDGIAFELKTRGFVELAKKIQSVIKENKSTRLKDLV